MIADTLRRMSVAGLLLAATGLVNEAPARADEMNTAFAAAFGAAAPVTRIAERPDCWLDDCPGPVKTEARQMSVAPSLLVHLGDERYALLALETDPAGGHVDPGAIAVAYLDHTGGRWRAERVWPELAWSGSFGKAADRAWILDKPGEKLLMIASEFLGMEQGLTTFWVVALGDKAPRLLGTMPGGAAHFEEGSDASCGPYGYAADPGPPGDASDVMSVLFTGWTARHCHIASKVRFSVRTEVTFGNGAAVPHPWIQFPACGN